MNKSDSKFIVPLIVLLLAIVAGIILYIRPSISSGNQSQPTTSQVQAQPEEATSQHQPDQSASQAVTSQVDETSHLNPPQSAAPANLEEALGHFNYNRPETFKPIKDLAQATYGDDYLAHQEEILQLLADKNLIKENFGFAFLPDRPATHTPLAESGYQLDVPLLLQGDPEWARVDYGDENERFRQSGCAIASLAMVDSYLSDTYVLPTEVLEWSKEDYWVEGEGTSWQVFEDYAKYRHFSYQNHEGDFESAMAAIEAGEVVIASIVPGQIAPVGHILVIRGYDPDNQLVYLNDPNDDPQSMFALRGLDQEIVIEESINYWSFGQR